MRKRNQDAAAQEVMRIFRQDCGARMHWGKAGWPQWAACFDGAREYPDSWCHFGCAVQVLSPSCTAMPSSPGTHAMCCRSWT